MTRPNVLLVSLGGTITMTAGAGAGIAPTLTADDLVPALAAVVEIEAISPLRLPSASLTIANLREIARLLNQRLADDVAGAVIVQGTDTIEETAFALDLLVESNKPMVVTGAMRGAEAPGADGPANLLSAVITAASPLEQGQALVNARVGADYEDAIYPVVKTARLRPARLASYIALSAASTSPKGNSSRSGMRVAPPTLIVT
jgi:L-asparaginase